MMPVQSTEQIEQTDTRRNKWRKKRTSWKNKSLEEIFSDLEQTIKKMEEGEISLEESFQLYHQGMDMLKACNSKIDKVEKKMLLLDEEGEEHEF